MPILTPGESPELELAERRDERLPRLTIAGFAVVLLAAIVLSIHFSTLGLSFGSLLYGSPVLWRGHGACFRLAAINPQGMRLVPLLDASFALRDNEGVRLTRHDRGVGFLEVAFDVPGDLSGHPVLEVTLRTEHGEDAFDVPLRAVAEPGAMRGRIAPHTEALAPHQPVSRGALRVAAYPVAGTVVAGFDNVVHVRLATQDGVSYRGPVRGEGVGFDGMTDSLGFFSFVYRPPPKPEPLRLQVGQAPAQTLRLPLDVRASQLLLSVAPRGWVQPGGSLDITVRTLPFRDPVHIDVWVGDALVLGTSEPAVGGQRAIEVVLPRDMPEGWVRVDAYKNLFGAEDTVSSALLWASPETPERAAAAALRALSDLPGGDETLSLARAAQASSRPRLLGLAASRFVPSVAGAPLLRSTLESRKAQVVSQRRRVRGHLNTLFVLTLGLGVGLAIAWSIQHQIRVRRAVRGVMEEAIAAGEPVDVEGLDKLVRLRHLYDLALTLAALFLAGYATFVLLTRMQWG